MSIEKKHDSSFHVDFYAAERVFYQGLLEFVAVPSLDGEYGVLCEHENAVVAIVPGVLKYKHCGADEIGIVAVSDGMMRIENGRVLILVESAERPEEIDENRARREADEAKEAMLQKKSIHDYYLAEAVMYRATNRLKVKKRHRG